MAPAPTSTQTAAPAGTAAPESRVAPAPVCPDNLDSSSTTCTSRRQQQCRWPSACQRRHNDIDVVDQHTSSGGNHGVGGTVVGDVSHTETGGNSNHSTGPGTDDTHGGHDNALDDASDKDNDNGGDNDDYDGVDGHKTRGGTHDNGTGTGTGHNTSDNSDATGSTAHTRFPGW